MESYSGHLIEWLHRGQMDLAVIYGPSADLHLTVQSLGRDKIVAVGPRGCGLARKKQVEIDWLLRQRLVLPSHSHGLRTLIEQTGSYPQRPWQIYGHRFVTISAATYGNPICIRLWRQGLSQTGEARAWSGRRPQISRRSF